MGYRLPLDSLPWTSANDYPYIFPPDPTQPFPPLASSRANSLSGRRRHASRIAPQQSDSSGAASATIPSAFRNRHESAAWITRTAICAEARNGVLYVFMPPRDALEDYLELVLPPWKRPRKR